jgi:predicted glycoside hydrolase/deacetylase ChbG (UPF0249 family)
VRRLIVNADDFGVTPGVNRAILEASQRGIVTSATMMASARAFEDAAELARAAARDGTRLSAGCHVILVDGTPLVPREQIPSLLDHQAGVPQFRKSLSSFALAALTGRLNPSEIEAEAAAQIERVQKAGIPVSHVDTHKHAHMFPAVLRPLLRAAKQYEIRGVRNPFEPAFSTGVAVSGWKLRKRRWQMRLLGGFEGNFRREVAAHGLRTTDGVLGVLATGVLDLSLFIEIASSIPDGTWEFVCHPGYNDIDLAGIRTRLCASRQVELEVLTSPEAKQALERRGVQLISYHEL